MFVRSKRIEPCDIGVGLVACCVDSAATGRSGLHIAALLGGMMEFALKPTPLSIGVLKLTLHIPDGL